MLSGSYNTPLVLCSVLVALLASYTALDLVGRIHSTSRAAARWWLLGGGTALGIGIWSMHFIGMMAFSLPIELAYDVPLTLLSLLVAIGASMLALWLASRDRLPWPHLGAGALMMGAGIAVMHYTGMASMEMQPGIVYTPELVAASVVIAVLAAGAALWIAHQLRQYSKRVRHLRMGAAVLMALAIVAMHYTGMAAASFPLGSICGAAEGGGLNTTGLSFPIIVATVAVLSVALITSVLDLRMEISTAQLSRSLAAANQELSHLVLHDNLTKLPNRLLLGDRLKQAVEHAEAAKNQVAVMFLDLDGFKGVNDSFGHQTGDQLLVQVAARIRQSVRAQDTVARVGGDEFVLVATVDAPQDAAAIADELVRLIDEPLSINGHELLVTASIGIAIHPSDASTPDDLLKAADTAMYHAKSLGRNQYCFFESSMKTNGASHLALLQDLRLALKRQEFELHYQPKFRAPDGPLTGVEALLRWRHPTRGMVMPDDFIPLAERTGQIVTIGEWVIDEACRQLADWRARGREDLSMAVNISPVQFSHANFVPTVRDALERHRIGTDQLVLEITETTAMRDVDASLVTLHDLRELGVRISIDDFGTGYSSLLYLKRLPASELKIDRGFISELKAGSEDAAIVASIIALGETLNLNIVAEGVETNDQQALLTQLGCDSLQGYLLGRPVSAHDLEKVLMEGAVPQASASKQ
ncbi:bifunctional diguanylate cyclase/phosphodiesterase [Bordetella sp. LUAb4]|uniref:putative bifunctional diguanylate cyclase/phosphodiesterase n=1 Tax=Bordetella sp. LUAb4 TaxID=2843195 RepID=UPI001E3324C6|nr:GGDEF domain-containing phosphodiesterase [Bordetella sp. LUAb4]